MFDRQTFQTLVTKLDQKAVSLKEAHQYAARFGVVVEARTKKAFIKALSLRLPEKS